MRHAHAPPIGHSLKPRALRRRETADVYHITAGTLALSAYEDGVTVDCRESIAHFFGIAFPVAAVLVRAVYPVPLQAIARRISEKLLRADDDELIIRCRERSAHIVLDETAFSAALAPASFSDGENARKPHRVLMPRDDRPRLVARRRLIEGVQADRRDDDLRAAVVKARRSVRPFTNKR